MREENKYPHVIQERDVNLAAENGDDDEDEDNDEEEERRHGDEEEEEDGYIFFRAPNGADTCKRSGRTRLPLMSCLESPLPSPAGQRGNRF